MKSLFVALITALLILVSVSVKSQAKTFALLDASKTVTNIVVVSNQDAPTEAAGIEFLRRVFKSSSVVAAQCYYSSQDTSMYKKRVTTIGSKYDIVNDCFVSPKPPVGAYTFNTKTCKWDTAAVKQTTIGIK